MIKFTDFRNRNFFVTGDPRIKGLRKEVIQCIKANGGKVRTGSTVSSRIHYGVLLGQPKSSKTVGFRSALDATRRMDNRIKLLEYLGNEEFGELSFVDVQLKYGDFLKAENPLKSKKRQPVPPSAPAFMPVLSSTAASTMTVSAPEIEYQHYYQQQQGQQQWQQQQQKQKQLKQRQRQLHDLQSHPTTSSFVPPATSTATASHSLVKSSTQHSNPTNSSSRLVDDLVVMIPPALTSVAPSGCSCGIRIPPAIIDPFRPPLVGPKSQLGPVQQRKQQFEREHQRLHLHEHRQHQHEQDQQQHEQHWGPPPPKKRRRIRLGDFDDFGLGGSDPAGQRSSEEEVPPDVDVVDDDDAQEVSVVSAPLTFEEDYQRRQRCRQQSPVRFLAVGDFVNDFLLEMGD